MLKDDFSITQYVWKESKTGKNRQKKGLMVASVSGDTVLIGYSYCNTGCEKFNPIRAKMIAFDRADKYADYSKSKVISYDENTIWVKRGLGYQGIKDSVVFIPAGMEAPLKKFIERCKNIKGAADMQFPKWVDN